MSDPAASTEPYRTSEQTTFNLDVILFYISCTVVGVAAAVATVAWFVFSHITAGIVIGWVGAVMTVVASIVAWMFLARARRER